MPGAELRLGLRPEAVSIAPRGASGALAATIRQVEHLGPEAIVQAALSDGAHRVVLRIDAAAGASLSPGQATQVQISPDAALLFDAKGLRLRPGETPLRAVAAHG